MVLVSILVTLTVRSDEAVSTRLVSDGQHLRSLIGLVPIHTKRYCVVSDMNTCRMIDGTIQYDVGVHPMDSF